MRSRRVDAHTNGVAIDVVDGPVTAATEYLRWATIEGSVLNLIIIGLVALIVAVALVPVDAAEPLLGT